MNRKYKDFKSLKSLVVLEIFGKVTKMDSIFGGCNKLVDLSALKDWDVSNVTTMWAMFTNCSSLVDLSVLNDWDVSGETNISSIFEVVSL